MPSQISGIRHEWNALLTDFEINFARPPSSWRSLASSSRSSCKATVPLLLALLLIPLVVIVLIPVSLVLRIRSGTMRRQARADRLRITRRITRPSRPRPGNVTVTTSSQRGSCMESGASGPRGRLVWSRSRPWFRDRDVDGGWRGRARLLLDLWDRRPPSSSIVPQTLMTGKTETGGCGDDFHAQGKEWSITDTPLSLFRRRSAAAV